MIVQAFGGASTPKGWGVRAKRTRRVAGWKSKPCGSLREEVEGAPVGLEPTTQDRYKRSALPLSYEATLKTTLGSPDVGSTPAGV